MSLATDLRNIIGRPTSLIADDKALALLVLDILENNGISTMEMVLHLNEKRKANAKKMERDYWTALDFACGALVGVSKRIEEGKKPKTYLDNTVYMRDHITVVINFLKMWVENPENGGFSETSRWLIDKTLETFDMEQYLEGGSSHGWASQFGHADYIARLAKIKASRGAVNKPVSKKDTAKCPPKKTTPKKNPKK